MSIEGKCQLFTIYFPGIVCFVFYYAKISGERLQDHCSSGPISNMTEKALNKNISMHLECLMRNLPTF